MVDMTPMTYAQVLARLQQACDARGGYIQWANRWGFEPDDVLAVLQNTDEINDAMCRLVGVIRDVSYRNDISGEADNLRVLIQEELRAAQANETAA